MERIIEFQELNDISGKEDKNLLIESNKTSLGIDQVASFRYRVDKTSTNWTVNFNSGIRPI